MLAHSILRSSRDKSKSGRAARSSQDLVVLVLASGGRVGCRTFVGRRIRIRFGRRARVGSGRVGRGWGRFLFILFRNDDRRRRVFVVACGVFRRCLDWLIDRFLDGIVGRLPATGRCRDRRCGLRSSDRGVPVPGRGGASYGLAPLRLELVGQGPSRFWVASLPRRPLFGETELFVGNHVQVRRGVDVGRGHRRRGGLTRNDDLAGGPCRGTLVDYLDVAFLPAFEWLIGVCAPECQRSERKNHDGDVLHECGESQRTCQ